MDKVGEDGVERLVALTQCPTILRPGMGERSRSLEGRRT